MNAQDIIQKISNIRDVVVDKISLVSKGNRPAVAKAETTFSIFKTAKSGKLNQEQIAKLDVISKAYEKKTLFVSRPVTNAKALLKRAKEQGVSDLVSADEMHVTIAFSNKKIAWSKLTPNTDPITLDLENAKVSILGDAVVIKFGSKELKADWQKYIDAGASWDHDGYTPHISLSYNPEQDISKVDNFTGEVKLGAEELAEVKAEYIKKLQRGYEAILKRHGK